MRIVISNLAGSADDLTLLFDGAAIGDLFISSGSNSLTVIELAIPNSVKVGLVDIAILTSSGFEASIGFEYAVPCDTSTFCQKQGDTYVFNAAAAVGYTCALGYCMSPEMYPALVIENIHITKDMYGGNRTVSLSVQYLILDSDVSLFVMGTAVADLSPPHAWENSKVISFIMPTPKPKDLLCDQCGRTCKCVQTGELHDMGRSVTFRYEYEAPIQGPPVVVGMNPQHETIVVGKSYTVFAEITNIPIFNDPLELLLQVANANPGAVDQVRIQASSARSTKIAFLYLAPPSTFFGRVAIEVAHREMPLRKCSIYLTLVASKRPSIVSVYPRTLSVREAASFRIITASWMSKTRLVSTELHGCGLVYRGTNLISFNPDDSATITADFPLDMGPCTYNLTVRVQSSTNEVSTMNLTVQLVSLPLMSLNPSRASAAGGTRVVLLLRNFPAMTMATTDMQIDVGGAAATNAMQVLWSNLVSTGLEIVLPPALVPGVVQIAARHTSGAVAITDFAYSAIAARAMPSMASIGGGSTVRIKVASFPKKVASINTVMLSLMGDPLPRTTPFVVDTKPFVVGDRLEFDLELPVRATAGTVVLHLSLMIASGSATAFKQTVLVEYFKPPAIILVPSRAPSTGGQIITIQLFDFIPMVTSTDAMVTFGRQMAQIHAVLSTDMIQVRVPVIVPRLAIASRLAVSVIPTVDLQVSTRAEMTGISSFESVPATPKIVSCSPDSADGAGGDELVLTLAYFPLISKTSEVSVFFGNERRNGTVLQIVFSDGDDTMIKILSPSFNQVGWSFLTVNTVDNAASIDFLFYDSRVRVTCANTASEVGVCQGGEIGGEILEMTVTNFGAVKQKEQLEIFFAKHIGVVQDLVSSSMEKTTFTVRVPPLIGQRQDVRVDLTITNLEAVAASKMMAATVATTFRYIQVPRLLSANFESSGAGVRFVFDSETNSKQLDKMQMTCTNVLTNASLALMGLNPRCMWVHSREFLVSFGQRAQIQTNDVVGIRSDILTHVSGLGGFVSCQARVQAPTKAIPPSVSIFGPRFIGPCDDAVLRASVGAASRPLTFRWQCLSCSCEEFPALCLKLSSTTTSILQLDSSDLFVAGMQYTIAVTGTNFMGASSTLKSVTIFKTLMPIPMISLSSLPVYFAHQNVIIKSKAAFSSCPGSEAAALRFEWSQAVLGEKTDNAVPLEYLARDTPSLYIPGGTLPIGSYTFNVNAILASQQPQTVQLQVLISVVESELVAVLTGGSTVVPASTSTFALSGEGSYDPDNAVGAMDYTWSCRWQDVPCRHAQTLQILRFSNTVRISIPTAAFSMNTEVEIELVVTKGMRSAVDRTRLIIGKTDVPQTSIDCIGTVFKDGIHWINPNERLILRESTCMQCSEFEWTIDGEQTKVSLDTTGRTLIVEPGSLLEGRTYEFAIHAYVNGDLLGGSSTKKITVNRPPSAGTCSVSLADPGASLIAETTGHDLAPVELSATDMLTGTTLLGATYEIYSGYVSAFMGCTGLSCGTLIATVSNSDDGEAHGQVPVDGQYLILAEASGFYRGYISTLVADIGVAIDVQMVAEMAEGQDRVVLHWKNEQDLDVWVFDADDRENFVSWDMDPTSASMAGGTVTLDVDNTNGFEGPETTQFRALSSGTAEVWVQTYDDVFTTEQVGAAPATVEVYCHLCLDEQGQRKQGFVSSITQNDQDVTPGANWWKVGQFVAPALSDPVYRLQWQACTLGAGCYVSADFAPATARKISRPSGSPKMNLLAKAQQSKTPPASVRSVRFATHDQYRVECSNWATMHQGLTYRFGYTTLNGMVLFSTSDLSFMNLYLPSQVSVEISVEIRDALGAASRFTTAPIAVAPVALDFTSIMSKINFFLQLGKYTEFHNYADVIIHALRQRSSPTRRDALRAVETDNAMLTSNNIMSLETAFKKDPPTLENALQTLSTLASVLGGSGDVSVQTTMTSSTLLENATLIVSREIEPLPTSDALSLLDNVLVSVSKVLTLLRPMSYALEQSIMPQVMVPVQIAVLHLMRTEMAGETRHVCPSAQCGSATVSTYSTTLEASKLVGRVFPADTSAGAMQVLFSASTVSDVAMLMQLVNAQGLVDLHVTTWRTTWGRSSAPDIISEVHNLMVSVGLQRIEMPLSVAGRLLVTIPLVEARILGALSNSMFSLSDVPVRDSASEDLQTMLALNDVDADGQLDTAEMYKAFDVLLANFYFWECVQWHQTQWTSEGCTPLSMTSATVTCACTHVGMFAVAIKKGGHSCGDGRLTGLEECDDGNTVDGDGCSVTCTVERNRGFFCPGGDTIQASVCSYGRTGVYYFTYSFPLFRCDIVF